MVKRILKLSSPDAFSKIASAHAEAQLIIRSDGPGKFVVILQVAEVEYGLMRSEGQTEVHQFQDLAACIRAAMSVSGLDHILFQNIDLD